MKKYNIFGFNRASSRDYGKYRHCTVHEGARLIQSIDFPDMLLCPQCGTHYPSSLTATDVQITAKFIPRINDKVKPILSGEIRSKHHYDSLGNPINEEDADIMSDMKAGRKIIYYREDKVDRRRRV
jgi:hypothetical protein